MTADVARLPPNGGRQWLTNKKRLRITNSGKKADEVGRGALNRWTEAEDKRLQEALKIYPGRNKWKQVAEYVGGGRDNVACWGRVNYFWHKNCKKGPWTEVENVRLQQALANTPGPKRGTDYWKAVSEKVKTRSPQQCYKHANIKTFDTQQNKGVWHKDEIDRFNEALDVHGALKWKEIAEDVKTRSKIQCRTYWQRLLVADHRNKGSWKFDEIEKLKGLVAKHGTSDWVKVSKDLGTRPAYSCESRWRELSKLSKQSES